jgi:hypothetical protein
MPLVAPHGVHPGKKQEDAFNSKRKAKFQSFLLLFLTKSTKHAYQNKIDTNNNKNGYSTLRGFRFASCFLLVGLSIFYFQGVRQGLTVHTHINQRSPNIPYLTSAPPAAHLRAPHFKMSAFARLWRMALCFSSQPHQKSS